jgi:hypothetical protein
MAARLDPRRQVLPPRRVLSQAGYKLIMGSPQPAAETQAGILSPVSDSRGGWSRSSVT